MLKTLPRRLLGLAAVGLLAACAGDPVPLPESTYARDAAGRPAAVAERTTLRWPPGQPVDIVWSVALCGDRGYLLALRLRTVHVVDLTRGERIGRIGRRGDGPGEFQYAVAMGADCDADRLYVSEQLVGVIIFEASTGTYLDTPPAPADFLATSGRILAAGDVLYVPGLWSPGRFGYSSTPRREMYRGVTLGWRLPLAGGESGPIADPFETGCIAQAAACDSIGFDRLGPDAWVLTQGGGTTAAILSDAGTVQRRFDIRSPRFRRDGAALTWAADVDDEAVWERANSSIYGVYAHADVIATVHGHQTTEGPLDRPAEFAFYMNLHTAAGEGLVSDIRLPDLPVGRDGGYLLVIDYGEAGRWGDTDRIDLLRIPIDPTAHPGASAGRPPQRDD